MEGLVVILGLCLVFFSGALGLLTDIESGFASDTFEFDLPVESIPFFFRVSAGATGLIAMTIESRCFVPAGSLGGGVSEGLRKNQLTATNAKKAMTTSTFLTGCFPNNFFLVPASTASASGTIVSVNGLTAFLSPRLTISNRATVMLSGPPARLAISTRSNVSCGKSPSYIFSMSDISGSRQTPQRPSVQSRIISPSCKVWHLKSGMGVSTPPPRHRVMILLSGWSKASSSVSFPSSTSCWTYEWSLVKRRRTGSLFRL